MKTTKTKNHSSLIILAILALLIGLCGPAPAQTAVNYWTTGGAFTGGGGGSYTLNTTNFAVGTINKASGNQAVCTLLNVKSDLAGSSITIWTDLNGAAGNAPGDAAVTNSTTTITMATLSTNANLCNTNGLQVGWPVVIRHVATDSYEVRIVSSLTTSNVVVGAASTTAVSTGDLLYPMTPTATIPCGAATISLGPGDFIAAAAPNSPFLVSVTFTSAGQVNCASGRFQ